MISTKWRVALLFWWFLSLFFQLSHNSSYCHTFYFRSVLSISYCCPNFLCTSDIQSKVFPGYDDIDYEIYCLSPLSKSNYRHSFLFLHEGCAALFSYPKYDISAYDIFSLVCLSGLLDLRAKMNSMTCLILLITNKVS